MPSPVAIVGLLSSAFCLWACCAVGRKWAWRATSGIPTVSIMFLACAWFATYAYFARGMSDELLPFMVAASLYAAGVVLPGNSDSEKSAKRKGLTAPGAVYVTWAMLLIAVPSHIVYDLARDYVSQDWRFKFHSVFISLTYLLLKTLGLFQLIQGLRRYSPDAAMTRALRSGAWAGCVYVLIDAIWFAMISVDRVADRTYTGLPLWISACFAAAKLWLTLSALYSLAESTSARNPGVIPPINKREFAMALIPVSPH